MENLKNKKVVIIGGTAGIGLAVAGLAASKGGHIIIASSNQLRVDNALKQLPHGIEGYCIDVTNETQLKFFFEKIGLFDHLIFTAGESLILENVADITIKTAQNFFNVRYWGAFTAVKYAIPFIKATGSITFTSGIAGNRPKKGWALSASICAAMEGFTRALAMELAPIRINNVSPGMVKTGLWNNMSEIEKETMYTNVGSALLVKRVGEAADIAKTFMYVMEQDFGTGQTIIVDGGTSLI